MKIIVPFSTCLALLAMPEEKIFEAFARGIVLSSLAEQYDATDVNDKAEEEMITALAAYKKATERYQKICKQNQE